mmetsp:Transcript_50806/g.145834  ORF Transcript_50806/g.145834 Transcript_50806/m.145834 type:complete len:282 (-) Transcript_50806:558-1403(-)
MRRRRRRRRMKFSMSWGSVRTTTRRGCSAIARRPLRRRQWRWWQATASTAPGSPRAISVPRGRAAPPSSSGSGRPRPPSWRTRRSLRACRLARRSTAAAAAAGTRWGTWWRRRRRRWSGWTGSSTTTRSGTASPRSSPTSRACRCTSPPRALRPACTGCRCRSPILASSTGGPRTWRTGTPAMRSMGPSCRASSTRMANGCASAARSFCRCEWDLCRSWKRCGRARCPLGRKRLWSSVPGTASRVATPVAAAAAATPGLGRSFSRPAAPPRWRRWSGPSSS